MFLKILGLLPLTSKAVQIMFPSKKEIVHQIRMLCANTVLFQEEKKKKKKKNCMHLRNFSLFQLNINIDTSPRCSVPCFSEPNSNNTFILECYSRVVLFNIYHFGMFNCTSS